MATGEEIVRCARGFLGTPYKPHGRSAEGIDCLGLAVVVGQKFGLSLDITEYAESVDFAWLDRLLRDSNFLPLSERQVKVGDLAILHAHNKAAGCAIVTGVGGGRFRISKMIHCETMPNFKGIPPRMRVVEDDTDLDTHDLMMLTLLNLSLEALRRCFAYYRFPFTDVQNP